MSDENPTTTTASEDSPRKKTPRKSTKSKGSTAKAGSKTKTKPTKAKKTVTKTKTTKSASNGEERSMAITAATRLAPFMKNHPVVKMLAANGSPSNKQLIKLRDDIKELAAELREKDQGSKASQLSAANALVRRLERASR